MTFAKKVGCANLNTLLKCNTPKKKEGIADEERFSILGKYIHQLNLKQCRFFARKNSPNKCKWFECISDNILSKEAVANYLV